MIVLLAVVGGFVTGVLTSGRADGWIVTPIVAYVLLVLVLAFVRLSCGPTVRYRVDGLEVETLEEGKHFVPWPSVYAWQRVGTLCLIDLGPSPPVSARVVVVGTRRRGRRAIFGQHEG